MGLETIGEHGVFGGRIGYYRHASESCHCDMRFSAFVPPRTGGTAPVVFWLSGLTCTEDNFTVKAGAYRAAAELGLIVIAPDTSPRGDDVPDDDGYDFGKGAGFYVDATEEPWDRHYNMYSYVTRDLPAAVFDAFPADPARKGIMGHSMGGHGALTIWLKHQDTYGSVSAFAPIVAPSQCPWGKKALSGYLGDDRAAWAPYDATALMASLGDGSGRPEILVDQGLDDPFLTQQLMPEKFEEACRGAGQSLTLRRHAGYDHSYFFISTFIDDHLRHHAKLLG